MSEIIVGDSGTVLSCTISDQDGVVDIRGATVKFIVKSGTQRIEKDGIITDGANGLCQFVLNESDVQSVGNYVFQGTVYFNNGNKFSSTLGRFKVGEKL